jgi:tetratricopeptide (TPR) repeat protein
VARRDAWRIGMRTEDPTVYMWRILERTGDISVQELEQRRNEWLDRTMATAATEDAASTTAVEKAEIWALAYVHGIEQKDEAVEALTNQPAGAHWSQLYHHYLVDYYPLDAALGRAFWLGGKHSEAMKYLERTFERCDRVPSIFVTMRSALLYGRALEEQRNKEKACNVYRDILARWGDARPRSVTAEEAERRSASLGCAPR